MMSPEMAGLFVAPEVLAYFLVLFCAMHACYRHASAASQIISIALVAVTWFLILRYTSEFMTSHREGSVFDEAYRDVMEGQAWGATWCLLTWVVVATLWIREASAWYLLFGMLGAMSGAFTTWVGRAGVNTKPQGRIPFVYIPFTVMSLLSIAWQYEAHILGDDITFSFWLRSLHVFLVAPCILSTIGLGLASFPSPVILYGSLTLLLGGWWQGSGMSLAWPRTDCQLSIGIDMVACSTLTIVAMFRDMGPTCAFIGALLMPFVSPGGVLAGYLTVVHWSAAHANYVTSLQAKVANWMRGDSTPGKPEFMNLGLWREGSPTYDIACQSLADALAEAIGLGADDGVLTVGCGEGAELLHYKNRYHVRHITGVDRNESNAKKFVNRDHCMRLLALPAEDISGRFPNGMFDKVLALDSVYHFPLKQRFFSDAAALLPDCGMLGVTDVVLTRDDPPMWLKGLLWFCGIPSINLWTRDRYHRELSSAGFCEVKLSSLGGRVTASGFAKHLFSKTSGWLDYCVVTAVKKPCNPNAGLKRRKVAIIGSGMSGLTAARELTARGGYQVTVFEAGERPGMAGHESIVDGQVVDVPLRMVVPDYYKALTQVAKEAGVYLAPIRDDYLESCVYSEDGPKVNDNGEGERLNPLEFPSSILDLLKIILRNIPDVFHFSRTVHAAADSSYDTTAVETWQEWLTRNGYVSDTRNKNIREKETEVRRSEFMFMMTWHMSWILSCTFEQVMAYPARAILDFVRLNRLGHPMRLLGRQNEIMRVQPSVKAMETALLYGCSIKCNKKISGIDPNSKGKHIIDGEEFDQVVVATEASAVPHILKGAGRDYDVFSKFEYEPSRIVLHRDSTLMPPQKKEWRSLNVCHSHMEKMCMLTAWLNVYYPRSSFGQNVFQTWNPHREPKKDSIIRSFDLARVVHSSKTQSYLEAVESLQGRGGIYFAGSYCVYGMGLLEEATRSGRHAACLVAKDNKL